MNSATDMDLFGETVGDSARRALFATLKYRGILPPVAGYDNSGQPFYRISSLPPYINQDTTVMRLLNS